jgi:hypothetical protein
VARNKTVLRVDATDESRRSTLFEAEQDEADDFSLQQSGTAVAKISSPTAGSNGRCSSAKLFILRNPVGVVDAVVVAGGEGGDGATRLVGRR